MSAQPINDDEPVVRSLARAVDSIDGARRVGWAKAFAAEERAESVSRDYNMAVEERDTWQRFSSFMAGFLNQYCAQRHVQEATETIANERKSLELLWDDDSYKRGQKVGKRVKGADHDLIARRTDEHRAKVAAHVQIRDADKHADLFAVSRFAQSKGFKNKTDLSVFLREPAVLRLLDLYRNGSSA